MRHEPDTRFLDSLRGIAALWVVLGYCAIWGGGHRRTRCARAEKAVDLFMAVSGFLMFYTVDRMSAGRDSEARSWRFWRGFYLRRYLHIAPAYYVALIAVTVLSASYSAGYVALQTLNPAHWILTRGLTMATDKGWIARFPEPSPLPVRFGMFMVGCLLYEAGRTRRPALFCLAAMALIIAARLYGALGTSFLAVIIGLFGWLWAGYPRAAVQALMRSRAVRFLSDTSYGLYLFHGFVLSLLGSRIMAALGPGLPSVLAMTTAVVPAAYALAWLVFRLVERPGIHAAKVLLSSRKPVAISIG